MQHEIFNHDSELRENSGIKMNHQPARKCVDVLKALKGLGSFAKYCFLLRDVILLLLFMHNITSTLVEDCNVN